MKGDPPSSKADQSPLNLSLSHSNALTYRQRSPAKRVRGVPSMFDSLGVQVPWPTWWRWRLSEAQGHHREAVSEGSVEQNRDL